MLINVAKQRKELTRTSSSQVTIPPNTSSANTSDVPPTMSDAAHTPSPLNNSNAGPSSAGLRDGNATSIVNAHSVTHVPHSDNAFSPSSNCSSPAPILPPTLFNPQLMRSIGTSSPFNQASSPFGVSSSFHAPSPFHAPSLSSAGSPSWLFNTSNGPSPFDTSSGYSPFNVDNAPSPFDGGNASSSSSAGTPLNGAHSQSPRNDTMHPMSILGHDRLTTNNLSLFHGDRSGNASHAHYLQSTGSTSGSPNQLRLPNTATLLDYPQMPSTASLLGHDHLLNTPRQNYFSIPNQAGSSTLTP